MVHAFSGSDGPQPKARLLQAVNGRICGTTERGGPSNAGVVFSTRPSGAGFEVLHAFAENGRDGYRPVTGLVQAPGGRLYGTTPLRGAPVRAPGRRGIVYRIAKTSGTVTVLHTFTGTPDGSTPLATPTPAPDGSLYGTTFTSGSSGVGTAYRLFLRRRGAAPLGGATFQTGRESGATSGPGTAPGSAVGSGSRLGTTSGSTWSGSVSGAGVVMGQLDTLRSPTSTDASGADVVSRRRGRPVNPIPELLQTRTRGRPGAIVAVTAAASAACLLHSLARKKL